MTPEEKHVFDLQGYLVLDQVLPAAMVSGLNQALDEMESLGDEETVSRGVKRRYTEGSPTPRWVRLGLGDSVTTPVRFWLMEVSSRI